MYDHDYVDPARSQDSIGGAEGKRPRRYEDVPDQLKALDQWVAWKLGPAGSNGKRKKSPINPHTGRSARTNDKKTWSTFEKAVTAAERYERCEGVGFVFTKDDPFCGVDLDNCICPETGAIEPWAAKITSSLNSYVETSPSGKGLKVFVQASLLANRRKDDIFADPPGRGIEVYDHARFFTVTGRSIGSNVIREAQDAISAVYSEYFGENQKSRPPKPKRTRGEVNPAKPVDFAPRPLDATDEELLDRARAGEGGIKLRELYDCGSLSYHGGDHSRADLALMFILARLTGEDAERMERLFSSSKLGRRNKWRSRPDYRRRTIDAALTFVPAVRAVEPSVSLKLDHMELWALEHNWPGPRGGRDRHIYGALCQYARLRGGDHPDGVSLIAGERELAEEAGVGCLSSLQAGLQALLKAGFAKRIKRGRHETASTYLLVVAPGSNQDYRTQGVVFSVNDLDPTPLGTTLRKLRQIREPSPQGSRSGTTLGVVEFGKLGKSRALVVEKILVAGEEGVTHQDLARRLGRDTRDGRKNLRKREVADLLDAGLLLDRDGVYRVPDDFANLLDRELEDSGCYRALKRQRDRHEQARIAQRDYLDEARLRWLGKRKAKYPPSSPS